MLQCRGLDAAKTYNPEGDMFEQGSRMGFSRSRAAPTGGGLNFQHSGHMASWAGSKQSSMEIHPQVNLAPLSKKCFNGGSHNFRNFRLCIERVKPVYGGLSYESINSEFLALTEGSALEQDSSLTDVKEDFLKQAWSRRQWELPSKDENGK